MITNRVVRWCLDSLEYEADPRQAEKLIHEIGLEGAKPVVTPGIKPTHEQIEKDKQMRKEKKNYPEHLLQGQSTCRPTASMPYMRHRKSVGL